MDWRKYRVVLMALFLGLSGLGNIRAAENPTAKNAENQVIVTDKDAALFMETQKILGGDNQLFIYYNPLYLAAEIRQLYDTFLQTARTDETTDKKTAANIALIDAILQEINLGNQRAVGIAAKFNAAEKKTREEIAFVRSVVTAADSSNLFTTIFDYDANLSLANELAQLPANTLYAWKAKINFAAGWQKLLANPLIKKRITKILKKIPVPLTEIFHATSGEWQLVITAKSSTEIFLMWKTPDQNGALFNVVAMFAAFATGNKRADANTIVIPLPENIHSIAKEIYVIREEQFLRIATAREIPAAAPNATPEFADLSPLLSDKIAGYTWISPRLPEFIAQLCPPEMSNRFMSSPVGKLSVWYCEKNASETASASGTGVNYIAETAFPITETPVEKLPKNFAEELTAGENDFALFGYFSPAMTYTNFFLPLIQQLNDRAAGTPAAQKQFSQFQTLLNLFEKLVDPKNITASGISSRVETVSDGQPENFVSRIIIHNEKSTGALWKLFTTQKSTLVEIAKPIPANVLFAAQLNGDFTPIMEAITATLSDNEKVADEIKTAENRLFFRALNDGSPQLWLLPTSENSASFVLIAQDKKNKLWEHYRLRLLESGNWRTVDKYATTLTATETAATNGNLLVRLFPHISRSRDTIIFAANDEVLQAAFAAQDGKSGSLADTESFRKIAAKFPPETNCFAFGSADLLPYLHRAIHANSTTDETEKFNTAIIKILAVNLGQRSGAWLRTIDKTPTGVEIILRSNDEFIVWAGKLLLSATLHSVFQPTTTDDLNTDNENASEN